MISKRDKTTQPASLAKLRAHLFRLSYGVTCDVDAIAAAALVGGGSTREIAARAAALSPPLLAGRVIVTQIHKDTIKSFSRTIADLYARGMVDERLAERVAADAKELDASVVHGRDFDMTREEVLALDLKRDLDGKPLERPQHALLRRSLQEGVTGSAGDTLFKECRRSD